MKHMETFTIYQNPDPLLVSRQAVFPGLVQLPDGELIAMFSIGQAFDAADLRVHVCRSSDRGKSWTPPVPMHRHCYQPDEQSETFKPLLLSDGTLLAAGYAFVRPDPLTPIVDPATFAVLPLKNKAAFSRDHGRTWTVPVDFNVEGQPLELSGPCIQLSSGRILGATSPFRLGPTGHSGWIIRSDDGGRSWSKHSEFFRAPRGEIAALECRLCEMGPDRIAVLFWAYDLQRGLNLCNHIAFSRDGGHTFEPALDTGIQAQASNLLWLDGSHLLTIHCHRESPVGLRVRLVATEEGSFSVKQTIDLFAEEALGSDTTNIEKQFGSLKFGQPSLLRLDNGEILAACWRVEDCQHVIQGFRLTLDHAC